MRFPKGDENTGLKVNGSTSIGISINTNGAGSYVHSNIALGSALADMSDDNVACATNTWFDNRFQTDLVDNVPDGGRGVGCIQ